MTDAADRPPHQPMPNTAPHQARLHIGCPMWAHPAWIGRHFPSETKQGNELEAYATWCDAVEGATTFYAVPQAATIARWAALAPSGFRFCFKLPRTITHDRRLRDASDELTAFLDALEPLHDRLGPIQIQLPPSFGPEDQPTLAAFLGALPRSFEWAVELRHPEFFVGGASERPIDDLLTTNEVNRVILDTRALFDAKPLSDEELDAWRKKPRLPVRPVATATMPIVRLIGQTDLRASIDRWGQWVPKLAAWIRDSRTPLVFTHTPDNVDALVLARRLHRAVADALAIDGIELQPLSTPRRADQQLDLW